MTELGHGREPSRGGLYAISVARDAIGVSWPAARDLRSLSLLGWNATRGRDDERRCSRGKRRPRDLHMTTAHRVHLRDHCLAPERVDAPIDPAAATAACSICRRSSADEALLHRIGAAGGFCDGGDCEGDATIEAGWPFFGQYVAHDITADRSPLRRARRPRACGTCARRGPISSALYGGGPVGSPVPVPARRSRRSCSRTGRRPAAQPRRLALIGDPRNDVHVFMSQMHRRLHARAQPDRRPPARGRRCRGRAVRRGAPRD